MKTRSALPVVLLIIGGAAAASAAPIDLPYRKAVAMQSRAVGLAGAFVQPLERLPGPGRDTVMADMLTRFTPQGVRVKAPQMKSEADFKMAIGDGWFVEVRGTGEWIRFRNDAYINGPRNLPLPEDQRPAPARLEARAREVVENDLAPFVSLRTGEELRGWLTSYLMNGSMSVSGATHSEVIASRVIFTRVINKVPVLGPGGKVAVILANDGALVGFDIDWPDLQPTGAKVKTVDIATIRARKNQLLGGQPGAPTPAELTFACGYYDPGVAGVSLSTRIGPACEVVVASPGSDPRPRLVVPIEAN